MSGTTSTGARAILLPLALAQFLCSYAGSSMNVMINDISTDLNTTVQGVQVAITIFLLVMAVLIIGNSIMEGVGTALLSPPVYILTTLLFTQLTSRAKGLRRDQRDGRHRR